MYDTRKFAAIVNGTPDILDLLLFVKSTEYVFLEAHITIIIEIDSIYWLICSASTDKFDSSHLDRDKKKSLKNSFSDVCHCFSQSATNNQSIRFIFSLNITSTETEWWSSMTTNNHEMQRLCARSLARSLNILESVQKARTDMRVFGVCDDKNRKVTYNKHTPIQTVYAQFDYVKLMNF